jgi:toxin ParE1/3/4
MPELTWRKFVRKVIVHPEAREETNRSAEYIEQKRSGSGEELLDDIEQAFKNVSNEPMRWRVRRYGYRRYIVQRFGYLVWYRERNGYVFVIAVHHGSRKPGYWKKRISDEQR